MRPYHVLEDAIAAKVLNVDPTKPVKQVGITFYDPFIGKSSRPAHSAYYLGATSA